MKLNEMTVVTVFGPSSIAQGTPFYGSFTVQVSEEEGLTLSDKGIEVVLSGSESTQRPNPRYNPRDPNNHEQQYTTNTVSLINEKYKVPIAAKWLAPGTRIFYYSFQFGEHPDSYHSQGQTISYSIQAVVHVPGAMTSSKTGSKPLQVQRRSPFSSPDATKCGIGTYHPLSRQVMQPGALTINVVAAKDLPKADLFGGADPFCVVFLVDRQGNVMDCPVAMKTEVLKKTLKPEWNAQFVIPNNLVDLANLGQVVFQVWDWDKASAAGIPKIVLCLSLNSALVVAFSLLTLSSYLCSL